MLTREASFARRSCTHELPRGTSLILPWLSLRPRPSRCLHPRGGEHRWCPEAVDLHPVWMGRRTVENARKMHLVWKIVGGKVRTNPGGSCSLSAGVRCVSPGSLEKQPQGTPRAEGQPDPLPGPGSCDHRARRAGDPAGHWCGPRARLQGPEEWCPSSSAATEGQHSPSPSPSPCTTPGAWARPALPGEPSGVTTVSIITAKCHFPFLPCATPAGRR